MRRYTAKMLAADCAKYPGLIPDEDAMECDECHKTVDRLTIFTRRGSTIRLCIDCLYFAYSDLRRAPYEKVTNETDQR